VLSPRGAGPLQGGIRGRRATHAIGCAAVLGKEADQPVHRREIGRVIDEPSVLTRLHETSSIELLQMKAERGGCDVELRGDLSSSEAGRALLDQQAKDSQGRLLPQRSQNRDNTNRFHIFNIIENKNKKTRS